MHDKSLHVIAKAIAENRDLMLVHVETVKADLSKSIAEIEPGVDSSFVENAVAKVEANTITTITETVNKTIGENTKQLQAEFSEVLESVKTETVADIVKVKQSITEVNDCLVEEVSKAVKLNDDTLNIVSQRFEGYDEKFVQLAELRERDLDLAAESITLAVAKAEHSVLTVVGELGANTASKVLDLETTIAAVEAKAILAGGECDALLTTISAQLKYELSVEQWEPGVYRKGVRVKRNFGDQFIAKHDTASEPTTNSEYWELVQCGMRCQGVFDESATYTFGDMVVKDGATWLHDGERLRLMAMRGEQGKRGVQGPQGPEGKSGLDAVAVKSLVAEVINDVNTLTVDIASETANVVALKAVQELNVSRDYISKSTLAEIMLSSTSFEQMKTKVLNLVNN